MNFWEECKVKFERPITWDDVDPLDFCLVCQEQFYTIILVGLNGTGQEVYDLRQFEAAPRADFVYNESWQIEAIYRPFYKDNKPLHPDWPLLD